MTAPVSLTATLARRRVFLGFVCAAVALWLAAPRPWTLAAGAAIAAVGEAVRICAAGHLDKGRVVTRSGPYRWTRHPLYVGSFVMGIGFSVAAARWEVAVLVLGYLIVTLGAAIRTEERWLNAKFAGEYDAYRAGRLADDRSTFRIDRARRKREHRAVGGLIALLAELALKIWCRG
jgi:protein-S-isoprenylcysteine O-methyltransferase Ste14